MVAWDRRFIMVSTVSDDPIAVASMFSIHGKVALVTGGSRGVGLIIVCAFVEAGASVYVSSPSSRSS
jgi:hypothetical protein